MPYSVPTNLAYDKTPPSGENELKENPSFGEEQWIRVPFRGEEKKRIYKNGRKA